MKHVVQFRRILWPAAGLVVLSLLSGCPFAPPFADFSAAPTEGDAPLLVRFAVEPGEGSTEIQQFRWDFGDGTQSVDERPVHTFENPGAYRISLTVSNANGSTTETKDGYVLVRAVPDVAFSATPQTGNTPLTVQFRDESAAEPFPATAWRWTFGDGEVSTEQHPVHQYVQPGAYDVSLTVTTDGGSRTRTESGYIQVSAVPSASFDASATAGNAPLSVAFTDTSAPGTSPITEWFWEFGDGATSDAQNPAHVYASAGIYSVSLTARNASGESTVTEANLITVTQGPAAAFSGTPREGGAPLVVSFADESAAGSSPITGWLWDFGDGTSSLERNPIHEFAAAGSYDVSLTVTTAAGMNTLVKEQYVEALAPPQSDFSASVTRGEAPLRVAFSDLSVAGASPITGRQWNFGDGTFSGDEGPVHVYATPGRYTVTLQVETAVGSSSRTRQDLIHVVAQPEAAFTASPTEGETPLRVNFADTSNPGSSPITEWLWEFGDGTTSDEQNPERVYNAAGLYTVKLTVTTDEGTSTVTRDDLIRVVRGPRADFTATPTSGRAPLAVQFRDASETGSEPVTGRVWDFGDGTTSTSEDPQHTYAQPGVYTVSLTTTTAAGPDTARKVGFVTVDPAVAFTLTPATGTVPATVAFTDTTDAAPLGISAWAWDFGDGGTSTVQNPIHTYTDAGAYDVTLTVTTEQGDAAATRAAAVRLRPQAAFSGEPLSGVGAPHTVQFTDETAPGNLTIRGWDWNFGDGTHSTQQNPSHTFTTPDVYDVTLTVLTDIGNGATTKNGYVIVRPEAAFSADVTSGVDTLAVQFTDETDPGNLDVLTWGWNFGDGTTSGLQHPAHTYAQPGTYTVSLTTGSTEGPDTETKAGYIVVAPRVEFSASATSGPIPLAVTFTDLTNPGTLEISARTWDVGFGDPSMDETPAITYDTPGLYDVTLTVTTEQGDASATKTEFIEVLPDVAATTEITPGAGSASVVFTNSSNLGGLTGATWLWDFDDGNTSTEESPTHNFATPGVFEVTLTVNTAEGVSATTTVATITIDPIPAFSADVSAGTAPLSVQFTDTSNIGALTVTAWAWDFGDGMTSTAQNPLHVFTSGGTREVNLTITTEAGDAAVAMPTTISVVPTPAFSGTPLSGVPPLSVTFANETDPGDTAIDSVSWDFGDGSTSTAAAPMHSFADVGTYTVALTVTTAEGSATETKNAYINVSPVISFSADSTSGPAPLAVNFTDTSTLGSVVPLSFAWDFGDGGTSTAQNPSHNYTVEGQYTVSLTITAAEGAFSHTETAFITVEPVVQFGTSAASGPAPLAVTLTDTTVTGNLTVSDWLWDFGDGSDPVTTQVNTVDHTYATPGDYTPDLTLITDGGDFTGVLGAPIAVNPVPAFSANILAGPGTFTVMFTDQTAGGNVVTSSRDWDFGDGATTTTPGATVSHTYTAAGTYDVTMTLNTTTQGSLPLTRTGYITAHPLNFSIAGGAMGAVPHTITVTNTTTGGNLPILSTQWDYGDGTALTASTSHTYTEAGTFLISMTITTAQGNQIFTGPTPIVVAPVATFMSDVDEGPAVIDVEFTDTTDAGAISVTSRTWDFGDGTMVVVPAPTTTVSHQYTNTGTTPLVRSATLTLNTAIGDVAAAAAETITINPILFSGNTTNLPPDLTVNFTDNTDRGDLTITSRSWDFKDGGSAITGSNTTSHTYMDAGLYDVELTITTSQGNMATGTISSDILVTPIVEYVATSDAQGPIPHPLSVRDDTDTGNLTGIARRWTWGDGATSVVAGTTASHSYATAGCYDVTMELLTNEGTFSNAGMAIPVAVVNSAVTFTVPTSGLSFANGVMFDLQPLNDLWLDAFTLTFSAAGNTDTIRLYTTPSTSIGREFLALFWTLLGDTTVLTGTGVTADTPNVLLDTGVRYGFYVLDTSSGFIRYRQEAADTVFLGPNIILNTNAAKFDNGTDDVNGTTLYNAWFEGAVSYILDATCNPPGGGLAAQTSFRTEPLGAAPPVATGFAPGAESEIRSARTPDGGRVAVGSNSLTGIDSGLVLIRADSDLEVIWELDLAGLSFEDVLGLRVLRGGDLLIAGPGGIHGTDGALLLARLDGDGNFVGWLSLDEVPATAYRSMAATRDGGLLLLSVAEADAGYVPTVHRIDSNRNVLWQAELPLAPYDRHWAVRESQDGSLEVIGNLESHGTAAWSIALTADGLSDSQDAAP